MGAILAHHGLLLADAGGSVIPFSSVTSQLHFDGSNGSTTFTDVTGKTWTPNGNAQISTAQSIFGGASGLLDGSGDYISTPYHTDLDFGAGDFTIELGYRVTSYPGSTTLINRGANTNGGLFCEIDPATGRLSVYTWVGGSLRVIANEGSGTYPIATWYRIALCREGSTMRLYRDGVQTVASTAIATDGAGYSNSPFVLGAGSGGGTIAANYFNGHMDELRVTKGVCRYPGGTTYSLAGAAFPDS